MQDDAGGKDALEALRSGGKVALARALAQIESAPHDPGTVALLDQALREPHALTLGVTGPPGVGKSSLLDAVIVRLRGRDLTVGVIAVDPSSVRSGGALLGDRARLSSVDPGDPGVFTRSMASRGRLGGVCDLVFPALTLMQALFDLVIVETVGVGQSETEISGIVDVTLLCIQPASGDSLQFLKAGIMEIPDLAVVTKSDYGTLANRAAADLRLALAASGESATIPVFLCSSISGAGIDQLVDGIVDRHAEKINDSSLLLVRKCQAQLWAEGMLRTRYGTEGSAILSAAGRPKSDGTPFAAQAAMAQDFDNWMKTFNDNGQTDADNASERRNGTGS